MPFTHQTFPVPVNLQRYIRNFWFFETNSPDDVYIHHATASVFPKITFGLAGQFYATSNTEDNTLLYQSGLNGQTNSFSLLASSKGTIKIFGVFLYPNCLTELTGVPADVFSNQNLDLETIWGADGLKLEEQVMMATDHSSRVKLVCLFFERKLNQSWPLVKNNKLIHAMDHLLNTNKTPDFKKLSDTFCLSLRQFERRFKAISGFSPKHFHRISRFEHSTAICLQNRFPLTDIAYTLGYSDQSHFTHDFKTFSGFSPKTYLKIAAEDLALIT